MERTVVQQSGSEYQVLCCQLINCLNRWMSNFSPIQITAFQCHNECFCCCNISGHGDVMHIAKTQQVHFIWFRSLAVDRVTEEEQNIDFIAGNACADLLISALGAA